MKAFTKENCDDLRRTCQQIIALLNENVHGELMTVQKMELGHRLEDFGSNPIVATSGVISLTD